MLKISSISSAVLLGPFQKLVLTNTADHHDVRYQIEIGGKLKFTVLANFKLVMLTARTKILRRSFKILDDYSELKSLPAYSFISKPR